MTTSAPGKLLLFGEHAVVYGYPCIVTAIDKRLVVQQGRSQGDTRFIDAAIKAWGEPGQTFSAESSFSGKYGFGSSSAVTVATLKMLRPDVDNTTLFNAAYKIVLDVQGTGSGIDVAAAVYGGTLYYMKDKIIEPMSVSDMPLIVGYTGVKANTTTIIKDVAAKRENEPQKVNKIFEAIGKFVEEAKQKMVEGDWERVGKLMDFNQEYLRDLGVSSEKLEALIAAAKSAGAWGAKLSGAGEGDCMIALAPIDKREAIQKAIQDAGGEVINVTPDAEGVRVETTDDQQELFVVVDEADKIIGHHTRYECHHDSSLIHRSIGVLIFDKDGRVLLQKRSMSKDTYPGYWGLSCAGHVVKGETYEQTALRELQEELRISTPITFHSKRIDKDVHETEMEALFTAEYQGDFHPNTSEIDEVKFFGTKELQYGVTTKSLLLTKAAIDNLKTVGIFI